MIKKKTLIVLTTIGIAGTIVGSVLLPIGCLKTVSFYRTSEINAFLGQEIAKEDAEMEIGVGASNYGEIKKLIIDGVDKTNLFSWFNKIDKVSYSDFIDNIRDSKDNLLYSYNSGKITLDEYNVELNFVDAAIEGSNLRTSGTWILVISGIILIAFIIILYKNRKQFKKTKKSESISKDNLSFDPPKIIDDDF